MLKNELENGRLFLPIRPDFWVIMGACDIINTCIKINLERWPVLIFPLINDTSRKIIHIDMDAFFAAIEVRDNPALKGKPVIIARDPRQSGGRGVVSTCSYEARAFGVHSAMSSKEAYERCPQGIFISGNYEKYQEVGRQLREIFHRYTDLV